MARTDAISDRWQGAGQALAIDGLRLAFCCVHALVIGYVGIGWLLPSRVALYVYLLLLPLIVLQWMLNGGASIINNFENLSRNGRWNDPDNPFEGALFSTFLRAVGIHLTAAQITTLLCFMMLIFWVAALFRMILMLR